MGGSSFLFSACSCFAIRLYFASQTVNISKELKEIEKKYKKENEELQEKLDQAGKVISTLQSHQDDPPVNMKKQSERKC